VRSQWAKIMTLCVLMMALCAFSCLRLRGRPPVEEEVETPAGEVQEFVSAPVQRAAASGTQPEYRLGYGDVIEVKFFYDPEFDQTVTVRPDGRISLPRLGDVTVAGMTPARLDELITDRYAEIIRDPDVTVVVQEIGAEVVYVLGEVNQPGGYPLNPYGTTVLGAIALAEGFKNTAKLSSVILIKQDASGIPHPERLNLTRAVGGSREEDPFLEGSEIVYVPSTFIAQLNQFMDQYFFKMKPPFDFYLDAYDAVHPNRRWSY
jgi:polysaccharide export outer membrane protein